MARLSFPAAFLFAVITLLSPTGLLAVVPTTKCLFKNWKLGQAQSPRVIYVGTTCTWINADDNGHCVNGLTGPVRPKGPTVLGKGRSWSFKFTKAGVYTYNCCLHANTMRGKITVVAKVCTPKCSGRCWGGDTCGKSCTRFYPHQAAPCDKCCRALRNTPANAKAIAACKVACMKKR